MTTPQEEIAAGTTGLSRRDALKQGIGTISAAGLAVSAPKIQGLATTPKYGAALSGIKKRRCHLGRVRFASVPRQVKYSRTNFFRLLGSDYSYGSRYYNNDPYGRCSYKGSVESHLSDFLRVDLPKILGRGSCYGGRRTSEYLGEAAYECIVAENENDECAFMINFESANLINCLVKNVLFSNRRCRVDSSSYNAKAGYKGDCTIGGFFSCSPSYEEMCEVDVEVEMEEDPADTFSGK